MARAETSRIDELAPEQAFQALKTEPSAAMVDVRTNAEWTATGFPDVSNTGKQLWPIEWIRLPDMAPNPNFVEELLGHAGGELPERLFFICKSGIRSMVAAHRVAQHAQTMDRSVHCTNVAEGYEGDRHYGQPNGWIARGLPWRQV